MFFSQTVTLNISEVLLSLNLLASSLVDERPEDVAKFYTSEVLIETQELIV